MSEPNVAGRLRIFMIILFIGGFALLVAGLPLTLLGLWPVAVPILVGGGTLLFVGILLALFFNTWIEEALKKGRK